jgi:hypothetical protein
VRNSVLGRPGSFADKIELLTFLEE